MKMKFGFTHLIVLIFLLTACINGGESGSQTNLPQDSDANQNEQVEPIPPAPGENQPGLTGETITLFLMGDNDGIYDDLTENVFSGAMDYVSYLNDNGGIFGAEVKLSFVDAGGSEEEAQTEFNHIVEEDQPVVVVVYGSAEDALVDAVRAEKVPAIGLGMGQIPSKEIAGGYLFRLAPTVEEQFLYLLEYLVVNWEAVRPAGAERPVAGYVTWEEGDSVGGLTEAVRAKAEELFVPIVVETSLRKSPNASATAAILDLEINHVNLVLTDTYGPGPGVLLNDLNNLALRSFFTLAGPNWSLDPSLSDFLEDAALGEGLIVSLPYAWWADETNSAVQQMLATAAEHDREADTLDTGYLLVQGALELAVEAIRQAILEGGFENLDGRGVYLELANMEGYSVLGGLLTVDFTDGSRAPLLLSVRQTTANPEELNVLDGYAPIKDD